MPFRLKNKTSMVIISIPIVLGGIIQQSKSTRKTGNKAKTVVSQMTSLFT